MNFREKILSHDSLEGWRRRLHDRGDVVVATNGCFDLLHIGHVEYLESARRLGDVLVVGVNGDASVRTLKGRDRPIFPEADRAAMVAALASVDAVAIFYETDALQFLKAARPSIYVKGGDYCLDTINQTERQWVETHGGRIVILAEVPGISTRRIIRQLHRLGDLV